MRETQRLLHKKTKNTKKAQTEKRGSENVFMDTSIGAFSLFMMVMVFRIIVTASPPRNSFFAKSKDHDFIYHGI